MLTFLVILPVLAEDVMYVLGVTDDINVGTVDRGFIDVSESLEVIAHPTQEILRCVVLLGRSMRDSSTSGRHLS